MAETIPANELVGRTVEWNSQAGGNWKHKRGLVVAVVPPECDLWATVESVSDGGLHRLHAQKNSVNERLLVRVGRYNKRGFLLPTVDYYAPTYIAGRFRIVEE